MNIPTTLLSQVDSSVGGKTGINTSHNVPTNSTLQSLKTSDSYFLEINRGSGRANLLDRSSGVNQVSFTDEKVGGASQSVATQNFQYDAFIPSFNVFVPAPTRPIAKMAKFKVLFFFKYHLLTIECYFAIRIMGEFGKRIDNMKLWI